MNHFDKVLSSYQHLGSQAYQSASNMTPTDAHDYLRWFLLDMPVVPFLLTFHVLFASLKTHALLPHGTFWLKSLVVTGAVAFGGSTLSAILSGRPVPLFTVSSNFMLTYLIAAWYVVHHSRAVRALLSLRPVKAALAFGAMAAKARSIFGFIDDFVVDFPHAAAGAIVLGGLAGSGGTLFASLERLVQHGTKVPSELSRPGWGFKSAYLAAALYYFAVDPDEVLRNIGLGPSVFARLPLDGILGSFLVDSGAGTGHVVVERSVARFYIAAALCLHAALETLYGQHINPLFWPERVVYAVTGLQAPFDEEETQREARERVLSEEVDSDDASKGVGRDAAARRNAAKNGGGGGRNDGLRKRATTRH